MSTHAPDCSAVIFAPGAKDQGWEPACDCGADCPDCGGLGYYATGPTDAPVQTQCQRCVGVRTSPSREPE